MHRHHITRNGRKYTLIKTLAAELGVSHRSIRKWCSRGLASVVIDHHRYVNADDCREYMNGERYKVERIAQSDFCGTVLIDGKVYHPHTWYAKYRGAEFAELENLPYIGNGANRYIAEEDFRRELWWKG